jgi:hypothetical protein
MLGKCANPKCSGLFRKLGAGKLFAFEVITNAKPGDVSSDASITTRARSPVFFWLCEICSLTFTLGLDTAGQLTLQRIPDGARVAIFDNRRFDHLG